MFDKPTSALDNDNRKNFYSILKTLQGNKTIIVITHKLKESSSFDNVH